MKLQDIGKGFCRRLRKIHPLYLREIYMSMANLSFSLISFLSLLLSRCTGAAMWWPALARPTLRWWSGGPRARLPTCSRQCVATHVLARVPSHVDPRRSWNEEEERGLRKKLGNSPLFKGLRWDLEGLRKNWRKGFGKVERKSFIVGYRERGLVYLIWWRIMLLTELQRVCNAWALSRC
jgi:hypothetical protein